MQRSTALLGSLVFLAIAPGAVTGYLPWVICRWRVQRVSASWIPVRSIGLILVACGVVLLLDCFLRFALQGRGTPAPVAPPSRLVVTGMYRYVRNPMYVGVLSLVLGQALWFANLSLLWYGLAVCAGLPHLSCCTKSPYCAVSSESSTKTIAGG